MPDQGIQPPYLDPSQYPAYLDLQRKQMLAQMLMGSAQQDAQNPPEWNSMRVVPRRSALQNITTLATALMAGKANKDALNAQRDYFTGMMGGGGSAPTPASAPPTQAPPSSSAAPGGPSAIAVQNAQQGSTPAPLTQVMPPNATQDPNAMLLVPGNRGQSQMLMQMMGPAEYAKALAQRSSPTDLQKQLAASGLSQEQQREILLANAQKATMMDVRPGGTVGSIGANGQFTPNFTAPQNGVQTNWGPNGPTAALIPGAAPAAAQMAGAEAGAKAANTPQVIPTAGGGSTFAYPQDIAGAPPALRSAPRTTGAPAPRVGQPTGAPPSAAAGGWASMPRLPISSAVGAPDAYTEGRLKAAGSKDAELSSQYGKEADLADQKLQYNVEARKLLNTAELGPSSEWLTENRAKLLEWGVPESIIPGAGKVGDTMELNKYLKQSALQGARQIFGSRMTQMEVKLQHEELSPSTSMTKDAIASLMNQDDIKQQYAKQRAEDYGKYIANHGDPLRFESWYAKNFPLTKFAAQHPQTAPAAAAPPSPSKPVTKSIGGKTYFQQNGKWYEQ